MVDTIIESESFRAHVVVLIYATQDDYDYGLPLIEKAECRLLKDDVFFIGKNAKSIEDRLKTSFYSIVDIDMEASGVDTTNYLAEIKSGLNVKEVNYL